MNKNSPTGTVLRVCLITQGVSPVVAPLYEEPRVKLISIFESAPRADGRTSWVKQHLRGICRRLFGNSLESYAKARDLPYIPLTTDNLDSAGKWLQEQQCDVIIVNSMAHLLPPWFLAIPKLGVLNLHPSILPAYRGPDPIFWMFYNAEKIGGVTLHYLDAGEDTGDIIYQTQFAIRPGMSARELLDLAIKEYGVRLLMTAVRVMADGGVLPRTVQPPASPTNRARRVCRADLNEYRKVIKWQSWHVEHVWHFLRAGDAWVAALEPPFGSALGQRWTVLEYERRVVDSAALGSIQKDARGYHVLCRDGVIRLRPKFSPAHFFPMSRSQGYKKSV